VRLRILAAALALPLALSGGLSVALTACGGDPAAPPPLTPAPSTASSPTPTQQAETAEEFIRRYQAAADQMQISGDTAAYLALTQTCESCEDFAHSVEDIYSHGGNIKYGGTEILFIKHRAGKTYDYRVSSGPTEYRQRAGGPLKRLNGGEVTMSVELVRASHGWLVSASFQLAGTSS